MTWVAKVGILYDVYIKRSGGADIAIIAQLNTDVALINV